MTEMTEEREVRAGEEDDIRIRVSMRAGPRPLALQLRLLAAGSCATSLVGCWGFFGDCSATEVDVARTRSIDEAAHLEALRDGNLDVDECWELCNAYVPDDDFFWDVQDVDECALELVGRAEGNDSSMGGAGGLGGAGGQGGEFDRPRLLANCEVRGRRYPVCEGRRHLSWGPLELAGRSHPLGRWFARAAANEAASVASFRRLTAELGKDRRFEWARARLRGAAREEIRHARWMDHWAAKFGARRVRRPIDPPTDRTLLEIAVENAVEGCVGETFAALVNARQALRATSAEMRSLFESVAVDEASHAELAWSLHWRFVSALAPEERCAVIHALRAAILRLSEDGAAGDDLSVKARTTLGVPDRRESGLLRRQLRTLLLAQMAHGLSAHRDTIEA